MLHRLLVTLSLSLCAAGCAFAPATAPQMAGLWDDDAFDYDPSLVHVDQRSLFALDSDLLRTLRADPVVAQGNEAKRTARLLALIFSADMKAFAYSGGHSTVAAETWRERRGDCLSLSVLSVALARQLDLQAQIQEVRVPATFDRRGGVDFLNAHVNVLLRKDLPSRMSSPWLPANDVVIDFEPSIGSMRRGTPLSDAAVLARFLNNVASEQLAQRNHRAAYAHFKAAIIAEPSYSASYSNLAQLYLAAGHMDGAEALLRHALSLNDANDLAMDSLYRLLLSRGRVAEAHAYEQRLLARREQDPYYWLGLGLKRLDEGQYGAAVAALERAQGLTTGFAEVHRSLAIAYWHAGQRHKARDQLAVLDALDPDDAGTKLLSRKLDQAVYAPPSR